MASGFDRRQPTRESFAFQSAAPYQEQPNAPGQSRGAQVIGGESRGGAVASGPQTDAGPVAEGLGAFVEQAFRPHLERRQQEEFFKGFTKAQSGVALDEIDKGNSALKTIFGPSSYEQGAQFFTAKAAMDKWAQDRYAEMDTLKRMPPEELSKVLAETSRNLMTGNAGADQILQAGLIEATGPLMNTVAKARYGWQQEQATGAHQSAMVSAAGALQALGAAQAKLDQPTEADNVAMRGGVQSFLGSMVKPEGMADETYKASLKGFMRGAMQDGNFYAVEAMRRSGVMKVFNEEEASKLDDLYQRYGSKVLGRAATQMAPQLIELDTMVKLERISPIEAANKLGTINQRLKAATGVDIDLFTAEDLRHTAGDVVAATIASARRAEDRRWQIEDRNQKRAWDLEDEAREEAHNAAQVDTLWGMGSVKSGIAAGLKANDFDLRAINDYRSGNFANIGNAYKREGWVSGDAASMMRARITSSAGTNQYTKDFEAAHKEWQAFDKASPAAAMAYYGPLYGPMQKFDGLSKSMSPQMAYANAFGDPAAYSIERVPPQRRKEVAQGVASYIDSREPGMLGSLNPWGKAALNKSSRDALANALTNEVAILSNNSDLPTETLVKRAEQVFFKAGKGEEYGKFFWRTPQGTTPLSALLKLQPKEAESVITGTIDQRLKAAGFSDGADGDNYEVRRFNDDKGQPALGIIAFDEDGGTTPVTIRLAAFATHRDKARRGEVQSNQPSKADTEARAAAKSGLDPNRRIPNERGWERVRRINLEVKYGSSPLTGQGVTVRYNK